MKLSDLVRDERGNLSTARVLLWLWSLVAMGLVVVKYRDVPNPVLAFFSGILIALISWAGGARIAQYLAPQVSATAQAVGQSLRHVIQKRRRPEDGYEETR